MMNWAEGTSEWRGLSWSDVVGKLAAILRSRAEDEDRFVIVLGGRPDRFVQFAAHNAGGVRGEAISNNFLTGDERLPAATQRALLQLGWKAPTAKYPNFWRTWKAGADPAEPAAVAVTTFRKIFGITSPASLSIRRGSFAPGPLERFRAAMESEWPTLAPGETVTNHTENRIYRIGKYVGSGGFGAVYRTTQRGAGPKFSGKLCLKVATTPAAWHREAYFGELLEGVPRAIAVHDSFATFASSNTPDARPIYCLVSEYAEHGDLESYLEKFPAPWTERKTCGEVSALLRVLLRLHDAGAVHRDLTARNVMVMKDRTLKLGDFGIARHRLGRRAVPADAFNPGAAPSGIADGMVQSWKTADDVYQMGLIVAALVTGSWEPRLDSKAVKALECSARLKGIIQRAIGQRHKRFIDAAAMLAAFEGRRPKTQRASSRSSLAGKVVVFTGVLSIPRHDAARRAMRAGARVRPKVASDTDILVKGAEPPGGWKADAKGQKLLDVDHERERGHHIRVIRERDFLASI